ncbi:SPW repeat protein [Fibrella forsythiae]|uniref:SPW repeat protein n=1 Tax=Fibrella forsythiae TaxID=2817061 RepID=A0ABS3JKM2_9BACT|nr:SPW repeat protein [Fibrella forsythiae]MBO0949769.1 SPW repeat protein [Fibrella forsythiae]
MALIPIKVHGLLDYTTGALFLASPWLLHFSDSKAATSVAVGAGAAVLGLSAFANYEAGVSRKGPMQTYLTSLRQIAILVVNRLPASSVALCTRYRSNRLDGELKLLPGQIHNRR